MNNLINNISEPETFKRNDKDCYFDKVSKQLRIKTPEEAIRQKLITYLNMYLSVPLEAMEIEVPLSYFKKGEKGRLDLVVYGVENEIRIPVMLVECKAPSVFLTDKVYQQADRYAEIIGASVVGITNGIEFILDKWDEDGKKYQRISKIPQYSELCKPQELKTIDFEPYIYKRFNYLNANNRKQLSDEAIQLGIIGESTPANYISFILNFYDCLMDDSVKCTNIYINGYKSIKDMGIRLSNFGNASGGGYTGFYRYFMLEDNIGNTQIAALSIFSYCEKNSILVVGIDDYNTHHHALQLWIESNVKIREHFVNIWHSGKMTVGNMGAVKSSDVIKYVEKQAKELVVHDKIFLGSLDNSKPLFMNSNGISEFLSKIMKYAFLRDEYRNIVKNNRRT